MSGQLYTIEIPGTLKGRECLVKLINPAVLLSAVGLVDKTLLSNTKDCGFDSRLGSYFLGT